MLPVHQHVRKFLQSGLKSRFVVKLGILVLGLLVLSASSINLTGKTAHAAGCAGIGHVVRSGETLGSIAVSYGTSWSSLAATNNIANPNLIYPGQYICIQGAASGAQSAPARQAFTASVQQPAASSSVAGMINQVFGSYAGGALNVARCESGLNPGATNGSSGAAGVFQILPSTWSGTSQAGSSPYNAYANIVAAHEIFVRDGNSWREWVCQP